jgi:hypothetical protein
MQLPAERGCNHKTLVGGDTRSPIQIADCGYHLRIDAHPKGAAQAQRQFAADAL